jgi:hypothetical protein
MQDPAPASDLLEKQPVHPWVAKILGGVTLWIGLAFVALLLWMLYKIASPNVRIEVWVVILLGVVAAIALFCLVVGYRLFLNRPNRYGSILGPMSWRIVGGFFGLIAVGLASAAFFTDAYMNHPSVEVFASILFSGAFSYWCFRIGRRASDRIVRGRGAP